MNDNKIAILRDMGLNNNGYADKAGTVVRVSNQTGASITAVSKDFRSLVEFGHLKLLGSTPGKSFYCLPEDYANVKAMMAELTLAK